MVMTAAVELVVARALAGPDERSWLRWGSGVFVALETAHFVGGLLGNDWEGWRIFLENFAFVAVTGLVVVGLIYGLLVRWGLKASPRGRNRAALVGLAAGVLSVASYAIFFTWAPILIAPGAILLGRAGLARARRGEGGRRPAIAGALLGLLSVGAFVTLVTYAAFHQGNYPSIFGG
jgi:hypothetical protein